MIKTQRISHPAFFGTKREETIRFYTELLDLEIVLRQPNLDNASQEHFFFHVGNDNFIAYFLPYEGEDISKYKDARHGSGGLQHLALDVDGESFEEAQQRLRDHGIGFSGPIERGYERSIYFRDPNGVQIELLVWRSPRPGGLAQADIIKRAQELRLARGVGFVESEDVDSAIKELG